MHRHLFLSLVCLIYCGISVAETCRVVTTIHNNPWEEGLGVFGDESVDDDSETVSVSPTAVSVGQMRWEISEGDKITRSVAPKSVRYHVQPKDSGYAVTVVVYPSERGVVLYRSEGKSEAVATFDCASVSEVEKASLTSSNVRKAKRTPKSVTENIAKVDIAFELGDGYYDLKESTLYAVHQSPTSKKVVGFLLWARLHYTEDNEDIEAIVRFDRNGLRLSEIEH